MFPIEAAPDGNFRYLPRLGIGLKRFIFLPKSKIDGKAKVDEDAYRQCVKELEVHMSGGNAIKKKNSITIIQNLLSGFSAVNQSRSWFDQNVLPICPEVILPEVSDYITYIEENCERYQYSRKYAWRNGCADGSAYNIDPLDYETEQEYNQAIHDAKYAWRRWASYDARKYGIDPVAFEKEEDFNAAVNEARKIELQKRREEQAARRNASLASYADPLAETDKTVYTFCGVMFESTPTIYHYRLEDDSISIGDLVIVPVGRDGKESIAEVVTIQKHRRATAPYPVDRAKFIKRKYEG